MTHLAVAPGNTSFPGGRQRLVGPPGPFRPFDRRHAGSTCCVARHARDARDAACCVAGGAICGRQQEAWWGSLATNYGSS